MNNGYFKLRTSKNEYVVFVGFVVYLIYCILPFVPAILPHFLKYILWGGVYLTAVLGLLRGGTRLGKETFILICAIITFLTLMYYGKFRYYGFSFVNYLVNYSMFWLPLVYVRTGIFTNNTLSKKSQRIIIILLFITLVTTIIGNILFPNSSRLLAGSASSEQATKFQKYNIGGYGFVYGITLFIPYIVYRIKNSKGFLYRISLGVFILLTILVTVLSQYMLSILIVCFSLIFCFIFKIQNRMKRVLLFILCFICLFVLLFYISDILESLSLVLSKSGYNFLSDRIMNINKLLNGENMTGSAEKRLLLYKDSFYTFLKSPVLGSVVSFGMIGGHSEHLDIMGGTGIIGSMIYIYLLSSHIKQINHYRKRKMYFYFIGSFLSFIVLASFNTVLSSSVVGLVLFAVPHIFLGNEKNEGQQSMG